jgi:hypothetical protein
MVEVAFDPLRRFAEEQIKEHGNGTADAWSEAVREFTKEIESVIGSDNDGESEPEKATGPADTATTDADS